MFFFSQIDPTDFFKIAIFMKSLKAKLSSNSNKNRRLLTSSFSLTNSYYPMEKYEFVVLSKYVDFMCFMQIYINSKSEYLTINEALQARRISNIMNKMDRLIKSGVSTTKLIVGVHFGGPQLLTTLNAENRASKVKAILDYTSICKLLSSIKSEKNGTSNWEKLYYNDADLAILKNNQENNVIIYENSRSVANKMRVVVEKQLGGVIITPIRTDDFNGNCDIDKDTFSDFKFVEIESKIAQATVRFSLNNEKTFPLLRTVNDAILISVNENTDVKHDNVAIEQNGGNEVLKQDKETIRNVTESEWPVFKPEIIPFLSAHDDAGKNMNGSSTETEISINENQITQTTLNITNATYSTNDQSKSNYLNSTNYTIFGLISFIVFISIMSIS